tara:strand:+ start:2230 stop:2751 length:522 start_codon:yes stop_codon:yes gene_type:complete
MPSKKNIETVEILSEKMKASKALYFTKYTGMNVDQANILRQNFTDKDVDYLVSKNTLTKLAITNAGFDEKKFDDFLNGQVGVAYAKEDPTAPAKIIKEFCKENECLEVVGLYFDGEVYDPEKYKELAALPSKEELIAKFAIGLNYPMTSLARSLKCTMTKFVNVLNDLKSKKN